MRARATALLAASALAAAAAGCGGGGSPSASSLLTRTVAATGAVKTFHIVVNVANPARSTSGLSFSYAEGDLAVPDRFRGDITGTFFGVPVQTSLVVVAPRNWLRNPLTGRWQQIHITLSPTAFFRPGTGVLGVVGHIEGARVTGTEQVGGVDTWVVKGTVPASRVSPILDNPPSALPVAATAWIGVKDGILRRLELAGPLAKGEPKDISRTVDVSRFDAPVRIVRPAGS